MSINKQSNIYLGNNKKGLKGLENRTQVTSWQIDQLINKQTYKTKHKTKHKTQKQKRTKSNQYRVEKYRYTNHIN